MKNVIKRVLPVLVVLFLMLLPLVVSYADFKPCAPGTGKICNPINEDSIQGFLKRILKAAIQIGIPLVVLAIIYSGFLFVTALGNSEKLSKAKDALIWSLIGAAVLLGSWAIAELIVTTVDKVT